MKQETERKQGNKKTENKQTEPKKRWFDADLPSLIEEDLENSLSHNARKWALDFPTLNTSESIHGTSIVVYCYRTPVITA